MKQIISCFLILLCFQLGYSQKEDNPRGDEGQSDTFIEEGWEIIDNENGIYHDRINDNIIETKFDTRDYEFKEIYSDYISIFKDRCFGGKIIFNPDKVIKKDCSENYGAFTFQGSVKCRKLRDCTYTAYVYFNGSIISNFEIPYYQSISYTKLYENIDVSGIQTPASADLRIVVYKTCYIWRPYGVGGPYYTSSKVFDQTHTMEIRSVGETYQKLTFLEAGVIHTECVLTPEISEFMLCCTDANTITFRLDDMSTTSTSSGGGIDFTLFDIKWDINDNVDLFNFSGSWSWSYNHTDTEVELIRDQFVLQAGPGECVFPGFQLYARRYLVETYEVECEFGYDILLEEATDIVPYKIEPFDCSLPSECEPPVISIENGGNLIDNEIVKKSNSCTGDITVTPEGSGSEEWTYFWEGPDDFTSIDQNLTDVPLGIYTLYVTNACCEEIVVTVFLCDEISYGDWELDTSSDLYCRDVICETCGADQTDQECVSATWGDYYFNESNLTCNRDLSLEDGTIINTESTNAEYEDSYNEFFEQCERTYFCDGNEIHEISENPDFGDWEYDDFWDECTRVISCFEEEAGEDEGDVSSVVSHVFGYCYLDVFCDGELTYTEDEENEIEWDYDDFFNECEGTILCFDEEVDEITTDPTIEDIEFDDFFILCEIEVSCDGSGSFDYTTTPSGVIVGQDDDGNDLCEVYCLGESTGVIITCADVNFAPDDVAEIRSFNQKELDNITVGPNPFTESITLENIPTKRLLSVHLIELGTGKMVFQKGIISASGELKIELDQLNTTGIFLLQLRAADHSVIFENKIIRVF
jgi:hypothetical protein